MNMIESADTKTVLIVLGILNIPVYVFLGWIVFRDFASFLSAWGLSGLTEDEVMYDKVLEVDSNWAKISLFFWVCVTKSIQEDLEVEVVYFFIAILLKMGYF